MPGMACENENGVELNFNSLMIFEVAQVWRGGDKSCGDRLGTESLSVGRLGWGVLTVHHCLHDESPRPHHAVCRSDRQSRLQIRHVWLCRSAAYHVITW